MTQPTNWNIIHGDALKVLESFATGTFDAVITDPPYASGGRTQAEKNKSTTQKYSSMKNAPPAFDGDAKDQRSWTRWAAEWLYLARKGCKPGAPVCMFIDWRQLPCSYRQLLMRSSGQAGFGVAPLSGTRATAVPRKAASGSRQSTSFGAAMGICLSPDLYRACPVCSSTAIPRSASISPKSPCSLCGTW